MLGRKISPFFAGTALVVTPWTVAYRPVNAEARDGEQTGHTVYAVENRTPSFAMRSRLGVETTGLPAQCMASARYSSAMIQRILGRGVLRVWAAARPAEPRKISRRERELLIGMRILYPSQPPDDSHCLP